MSDISHDYDEAEALAKSFEKHGDRLSEHHARTGQHRTRAAAGRGKDPLANIVSGLADRGLGVVEKALKSFVKHSGDTSQGIRQMSRNHQENDHGLGEAFTRINSSGRTPMYLLHDDGSVSRLREDGSTHKVAHDDASGIHDILHNGAMQPPKAGEFKLPPKSRKKADAAVQRPQTSSGKVDHGTTPLARATQLARYANDDYGNQRGNTFTSNNYAAVRYQDGNKEFILVGRSKNPRHSEPIIGIPLLRDQKAGNVQDLYTERAPCTSCSPWLKHFVPHINVSHSFVGGNVEMKPYLEALRKHHGR
ncbi:nucleic acid/nucleotide deaminase domain-containing protein [Kitasatospora sp. NPDC001540]|uniref:nucleic acid/nucleotide deaminase domain-containing protein n=1 Tax=Kitasatospora sp. NPDC001540 TaxID=3364014 RepID=UPI0036CDD703